MHSSHSKRLVFLIIFLQANFLRTHLPDVDIAADLIRNELVTDARITRQLKEFDPQLSTQLEVLYCQDMPSYPWAFLLFPMGELNRDLSG
jgi:hypothetical protein